MPTRYGRECRQVEEEKEEEINGMWKQVQGKNKNMEWKRGWKEGGRSQGKRLIFLVQAGYSRWTQSPLQRKENTPKAKSWNIALQRAERVPRANAPQCALIISTALHIQSPSDPLGPSISPASKGPDAISRQQRACLYAQRASQDTVTTCLCSSEGLLLSPWRPGSRSAQWGLTFRV